MKAFLAFMFIVGNGIAGFVYLDSCIFDSPEHWYVPFIVFNELLFTMLVAFLIVRFLDEYFFWNT